MPPEKMPSEKMNVPTLCGANVEIDVSQIVRIVAVPDQHARKAGDDGSWSVVVMNDGTAYEVGELTAVTRLMYALEDRASREVKTAVAV